MWRKVWLWVLMEIYPAEANGIIVRSQDVLSVEVDVCFAWLKKGTDRQ